MDFLSLVKKRLSVRDYQDTPISTELIEQVLEAGRLAPSAVNFQPWRFVVVRSAEMLESLHTCYPRDWFKTAPCVIVVCGDHNEGWHRAADNKDHTDIDVAIAADHLTLMAAELGLGSCWVCNFDAAQCRGVLGLPQHIEPVVLLPIGFPANLEQFGSTEKKRKPLHTITHWEKFE